MTTTPHIQQQLSTFIRLTISKLQKVTAELTTLPLYIIFMRNELSVFTNDKFGEVRTTTIDGEIWFVGKDVAKALKYTNPQKAIRDHVDEEDKTVNESFTVNGTKAVLINESGLYSLTFSSKLPDAKAFKHWVTHEVIPSIRKTGQYKVADNKRTTQKGKDSIVSQAKAFAAMVESMDKTMTLTNNQKLKLYHQFCDPLGLPVPDLIPSDGSCHTAEKLLKFYGIDWTEDFFFQHLQEFDMVKGRYDPKKGKMSWQLIHDGQCFGVNLWDWNEGVYIPFFYDKPFMKLVRLIIGSK